MTSSYGLTILVQGVLRRKNLIAHRRHGFLGESCPGKVAEEPPRNQKDLRDDQALEKRVNLRETVQFGIYKRAV